MFVFFTVVLCQSYFDNPKVHLRYFDKTDFRVLVIPGINTLFVQGKIRKITKRRPSFTVIEV